MATLRLLLLVLLSTTLAGYELAGDIFEAGAGVGALAVIIVVAILAVVVAKIRG